MRDKKGFTLIELLAIIVILAIIAVITVPIILNIIEKSKKGAAINSAYGYKDAVKKYYVSKLFEDSNYAMENKYYRTPQLKSMGVNVEGQEPEGNSWIIINNNNVVGGCLQYDEYKVNITSGEISTAIKGECDKIGPTYVAPTLDDTHLGIVYLDPINPDNLCNLEISSLNLNEYDTPTGIHSGCMKFYIYADNGDGTVNMILDHNTSGNVAWNSDDGDTMSEVAERLAEDTEGWIGNPRLIKADEVAHLVGADSNSTLMWDKLKSYTNSSPNVEYNSSYFYLDGSGDSYSGWQTEVANSNTKSRYAWLYDYGYYCVNKGCNISDDNTYPRMTKDSTDEGVVMGYWTQDKVTSVYDLSFFVSSYGALSADTVSNYRRSGVRPVITVSKSLLGID